MSPLSLYKCSDTLDHKVLDILREIGSISENISERCYVAGGLTRDCLLGKSGKDIDLVCSDSERIVDELIAQNKVDLNKKGVPKFAKFPKYGTVQVKMNGEEVELVNPRKETYTYELHQPEKVERGTFLDDALRRDFTLNALFLGIQSDDWMEVVDLTGKGIDDLKAGLLRTPLNPDTTFIDDPSRLFRLARFKSCKGFDIEKETFLSARRNAHEVNEIVIVKKIEDDKEKIVVRERVPRDSVKQMMDKGIVCNGYIKALDDINLLEQVIPEAEEMKDYEQSEEHHLYDVWEHTLRVMDNLPPDKDLRWTALFHDIGKPRTKDRYGTFHHHEKESEKIAKEVMTRLRFSNDEVRRISHLVAHHMNIFNLINQDDPRRGKKLSNRAIRRFAVKNDGYESDLIEFAYADTKASGVHWKEDHRKIEKFEDRLQAMELDLGMTGGNRFKLAVDGHDIMSTLHIKPGIKVGEIQKELTEKVMDGFLKNERKELLEYMGTMKDI